MTKLQSGSTQIKLMPKKLKKLLPLVKQSSKKQVKSPQKKTPRLILPRKLKIELIHYNNWSKINQKQVLVNFDFDFVKKVADIDWDRDDNYVVEENISSSNLLVIDA